MPSKLKRLVALLLGTASLVIVGCGSSPEVPPGTGKQILEYDLDWSSVEYEEVREQFVEISGVISTLLWVYESLEGFADNLTWAFNRHQFARPEDPFAGWREMAVAGQQTVETSDWMHLVSDAYLEQASETIDSIEAFRDDAMQIIENIPDDIAEISYHWSSCVEPQYPLDCRLDVAIGGFRRAIEVYQESSD